MIRAAALSALSALVLAGCGDGDPPSAAERLCVQQARGEWDGFRCTVDYTVEDVPIEDGRLEPGRVDINRRSCRESAEREAQSLRTDAGSLVAADGGTRRIYKWHPEAGLCEEVQRPLDADERAGVTLRAALFEGDQRICEGDGPAARRWARRAQRVKDTAAGRALLRDSRLLDAQQAANRGRPEGQAVTPAVIVGRCEDGAGTEEPAPVIVGDADCDDFPTQSAAQQYLESNPGDASGLDANGDGEACETLP